MMGRRRHAGVTDLDERKRVAYLFGAVVGLPVVLLTAVEDWSASLLVRLGHPVLAVVLLALGIGLARRTVSVGAAERLLVMVLPVLWFSRLAEVLYGGDGVAAARDTITVSVAPGLTIVVILIFLAFDARVALRLAMGVCGLFGLMVAPVAWAASDGPAAGDGLALVRMVVFATLVGLLVYVLADLKQEVSDHRDRMADLDVLAGTDPVTGIANRRRAVEVLETQRRLAERYRRPLAVALLDLDRFKAVNDAHGHAFGDRALRRVVEELQSDLRTVDMLARWGGDELLVIAPETPPEDLERSADRWRRLVADLGIPAGEGRTLTVSVGVTARRPGDDVDTMVLRADHAMYAAKGEGRDRTVFG
jgi:diguanylate cyclase (GGDEF)-like protein